MSNRSILYYANTKCVFGFLCVYMLRTGSLEVDASHLHRVSWVMSHHFCVAQQALGSRLRVLALAVQTPMS